LKLLRYKNEIPSEICNICGLISGILSFIENTNGKLDACADFELKVILNELILNAIKHGNNCDPLKKVKTSVVITNRKYIILLVEDEGEGYDYKIKCNCTKFKEDFFEMKESGRGIFIVSNLCDRIKFNKKGNKVIALKKL
jgi:serine/threonine-protein kinase RsbW